MMPVDGARMRPLSARRGCADVRLEALGVCTASVLVVTSLAGVARAGDENGELYSDLWGQSGEKYGPRMNFVGFRTSAKKTSSKYDWWFESGTRQPKNLWEAQVVRRLRRVPGKATNRR
jgi:hypothetical protein